MAVTVLTFGLLRLCPTFATAWPRLRLSQLFDSALPVTMVDVKKLLAIADLIIGCCVALEGVVGIIWMFDTTFLLAIFVIGCYQIFFGAWPCGSGAWHAPSCVVAASTAHTRASWASGGFVSWRCLERTAAPAHHVLTRHVCNIDG